MNERQFAKARDCISCEFQDEVLICDSEPSVVHCLNPTAAAVWRLCDGNRSAGQIATELSRQFSAPVQEGIVLLALRQLADAQLVVEPQERVESTSRRVAIRKIAKVAAIALPLVTSILAPTPASAASCLANGQRCTSNAQCCSKLCVVVCV
jgi:hypothetical protein